MAAPVDTSSQDHMLDCLARHICRMPTKADRLQFLDGMRKKKSPEFMTDIEGRVREQWNLIHTPPAKPA